MSDLVSRFSFFNADTTGHIKNIQMDNYPSNILTEYNSSPASRFQSQEKNVRQAALNFFDAFIKSRIQYLSSLKFLGNNWISQDSIQPNDETLEQGKSLLRAIYNWFSSEACSRLSPPRIVMGPLPSGGIAFEVTPLPEVTIYLSLHNDGTYELEVLDNGYFFEISNTGVHYADHILNLLSSYGIRRDYPGWRNFI